MNNKWWFACLALLCSSTAMAKPEHKPEQQTQQRDQQQTISYWKPYVVSSEKDPGAARAQRVFANLLRTWDDTRVEPSLYVVNSTRGPWAASLADGNILLSRSAIDIEQQHLQQHARHAVQSLRRHHRAQRLAMSEDAADQRVQNIIIELTRRLHLLNPPKEVSLSGLVE